MQASQLLLPCVNVAFQPFLFVKKNVFKHGTTGRFHRGAPVETGTSKLNHFFSSGRCGIFFNFFLWIAHTTLFQAAIDFCSSKLLPWFYGKLKSLVDGKSCNFRGTSGGKLLLKQHKIKFFHMCQHKWLAYHQHSSLADFQDVAVNWRIEKRRFSKVLRRVFEPTMVPGLPRKIWNKKFYTVPIFFKLHKRTPLVMCYFVPEFR